MDNDTNYGNWYRDGLACSGCIRRRRLRRQAQAPSVREATNDRARYAPSAVSISPRAGVPQAQGRFHTNYVLRSVDGRKPARCGTTE